MRKYLAWLIYIAIILASGLTLTYGQGPLTNALNLRVRTDSNGYLMLTSGVASGQGPLTALGNIRLRTDANGNLMVTVGGGTLTPDSICLDATNQDTCLVRDAANTLAQRNGTNAQIDRVYRTYTDPSNGIWLGLEGNYAGAGLGIIARGNGTGAAGVALYLGTETNTSMSLRTNGSERWQISAAGNFLAGTDNTNDIGATGGTRPRTGYFGTSVVTPTVNATTAYQVAGVPTTYFVTSNFTTAANTNLQIITGLVIPLPLNTVLNVPIRCVLFYSQATAAVSDSFGIQTDTLTPSNIQAGGAMETALGTTAYGDVTITNTTATAVVTGTPSATATVFNAYIDAFVENPSGAATNINIMVKTTVSGDAITVLRGSFCRAF